LLLPLPLLLQLATVIRRLAQFHFDAFLVWFLQ
jgi:hypothetical protein